MIKFFTVSIIVLGLATTAFSQTKNSTEVGVSVGYNSAKVTTNVATTAKYKSGFSAGLGVDHYFSDRWSLFGKFVYDQKGWGNGVIKTLTTSTSADYDLNYLTIPVLAEWHFGSTRNWYLNFGPYAGILLSASETATNDDIKDFFNSFDAGFDFGIGVKLPVSDKTKFFIELNGAAGGSDIAKNNTGSSLNNTVSNISVGLKF